MNTHSYAAVGVFALFVLGGCSSSSSGSGDIAVDGGSTVPPDAGDAGDASMHDGSVSRDGGTTPRDGATTPPDMDASITGLDGTTYYVSPTGSDTNPGTKTSPWLTIQNAGPTVQPGDTVVVEAGTYDAPIFGWDGAAPCGATDCLIAGTSAHPILFTADPSAAAGSMIIAGKNSDNDSGFDLEPGCDYVDVVGFTVTNAGTSTQGAGTITHAGIVVAGSTGNRVFGNTVTGVSGIGGILVDFGVDVVVQGNTVTGTMGTGTTGHGMYISGSSTGVQVLFNILHDNAYVGIHVNGDASETLPDGGLAPGVVSNVLIAGNVIYENGQNGINADGIENSTIENNVIYGNARDGIELYQIDALGGSTGNLIVNNTIDQSASGYAISIDACNYDNQSAAPTPADCNTGADDSSLGNIAFDNVLLGGAGATSVVASDDLAASGNITTAMSGLFVDSAGGNYTLAPSGPGAGTGVATYQGKMAPATPSGTYDIGAFSFARVP